ncbi:MAG TPA: C39 family peptidase [Chloroflexaceae bacterium]|nr:C39 family peptidase [Chloroflexaceae bacterium]
MSRKPLAWAVALLALAGLVAALALTVGRPLLRSALRPEPPAPLTPLPLSQAPAAAAAAPSATLAPSATAAPAALAPSATAPPPSPAPSPAPPTPVVVGDRVYTVLIPAAVKEGQRFQYTCEYDAAWVVLQSYGIDVGVDELIERMPLDTSVEPYIAEGPEGFLIYGGDILTAFSGDYTQNFLARSTGAAFAGLFAAYGLESAPVRSREELEAALLRGELVWMKTTVDFKPWRPATWVTPSGERIKTVLGNDHAVVVMGFNDQVVVIRDVLGPTSTGPSRPLEYEVPWEPFLAAWGAQDYDGLAVARP